MYISKLLKLEGTLMLDSAWSEKMLITPQHRCGNELPALCTALQAHKMQRPTWKRAQSQDVSLKMLLLTHHTYHLFTKITFPRLHWLNLDPLS